MDIVHFHLAFQCQNKEVMSFWKLKIDEDIVHSIESCNDCYECNLHHNERMGFSMCKFSIKRDFNVFASS